MKTQHSPETYAFVLTAREMDELVEGWRVFVRDYDVSELAELMLDQFEEVYAGERAGGRTVELRVVEDEDDDGGGTVAAIAG